MKRIKEKEIVFKRNGYVIIPLPSYSKKSLTTLPEKRNYESTSKEE